MAVKNTLRVYPVSIGKQSFEWDIFTPSDPTGDTPKFGLTAVDDYDGPSAWTAGAWSTSYDAATDATRAVSPTIGPAGTLTVATGNRYWVWAQVTLGGEVWPEPVLEIHVP